MQTYAFANIFHLSGDVRENIQDISVEMSATHSI